MIMLADAIVSINPSLNFKIEEETIESIYWVIGVDDNQSTIYGEPSYEVPTGAEILAEVTRLQAEYDNNAYARSRKTAYDALNQLELISDDAINGTTTHADAILAIKAEFPKPV